MITLIIDASCVVSRDLFHLRFGFNVLINVYLFHNVKTLLRVSFVTMNLMKTSFNIIAKYCVRKRVKVRLDYF